MDQIAAAEQVASGAHAGQTDKAGRPYLDHPRRVAARVQTTTGDPDAVAAGWLHDVVEDTAITLGQLRELGFSGGQAGRPVGQHPPRPRPPPRACRRRATTTQVRARRSTPVRGGGVLEFDAGGVASRHG